MKRLRIPILLLFCLLLCGCGSSGARSRCRAFSEQLAARETLHFTAQLRTEYPDRTAAFKLQYAMEDGEQAVTVKEPESIAGIRARLLPGETRLEYDDLILDVGNLDDRGLSPMAALPTLVEAMRSGHLDSFWKEGGELAAEFVLTDELRAQVRFEPESMTPTHAELLRADTVAVYCDITDWR
ncbi:MAG: hypothetical protein IJ594_09850 [Oscillospiraceae bacterium]|nr:hypothetical protein [Oscillospiraceae bacterium]